MRVGNLLESSKQAEISKLGGKLFDENNIVKSNFSNYLDILRVWVLSATLTMLCGTVTYPIAVRIARKIFRIRGFYAIHISIAPFLAFVHTNIFGTSLAY